MNFSIIFFICKAIPIRNAIPIRLFAYNLEKTRLHIYVGSDNRGRTRVIFNYFPKCTVKKQFFNTVAYRLDCLGVPTAVHVPLAKNRCYGMFLFFYSESIDGRRSCSIETEMAVIMIKTSRHKSIVHRLVRRQSSYTVLESIGV